MYIGFGSITVPDPHTMTEHIYQAVQKSELNTGFSLVVGTNLCVGDVRAIVSKGWSSRMLKQPGQEIEVPKECYVVSHYSVRI